MDYDRRREETDARNCANRECFFSENLALKAGLTSHRIQTPVWREECDKLMDDPEHSPEVHVKFQYLYNGLADAPVRARESISTLSGNFLEGRPLASYDTSRTSNSILTSSLALTPAFPGGLIPKSVCFTVASPV